MATSPVSISYGCIPSNCTHLFYAIAVGLVAAAPSWPTAVAACVLAGAAPTITFLTTGNATIQLAAEPDYRGRVTALWSMALVGTRPSARRSSACSPMRPGHGTRSPFGAVACLAAVAIGRWPGGSRARQVEGTG